MPSVAVTMIEGYSDEVKERLCSALTGAVRQVVPAQPDAIIIALHEVPAANYMRGGKQRQPAPALPDAAQLVRQFLGHMEARELESAKALLADTFTMTFPGGVAMNTLEDLIDLGQAALSALCGKRMSALTPHQVMRGRLSIAMARFRASGWTEQPSRAFALSTALRPPTAS
jgi:4-oxalocrotonate tautomerase family enzyme